MISRRQLLRTSIWTGAALLAPTGLIGSRHAFAHSPVSLSPSDLTPFVDPLPLPGVLRPRGSFQRDGFKRGLYHRVQLTEFKQQLHRDLPPTTVWGYNGSYPGPTIMAQSNVPIYVQYFNNLPDEVHNLWSEDFACVHGPDHLVPGKPGARRIVTHLHGGKVPEDSDGWPEEVILSGQSSIPYYYPNIQEAATLWYHDHALGITRLNVMMGLAGFYILSDPFEARLHLPKGAFDVPLAIQDRTFKSDGEFFYPHELEPEFFGDTLLVNGKVLPYLDVRRGKYRFRLLNGCNSRFLTLALSSGYSFFQIASEQGLLPAPVEMRSITLAPGERADIVVDFAQYRPGDSITLENSAAPEPFPGEGPLDMPEPVMQFRVRGARGFVDPIPTVLRNVVKRTSRQTIDYGMAEILDPQSATTTRRFNLKEAFPPGTPDEFTHSDVDPDCVNTADFVAVIEDEQGKILWHDRAAEISYGATEIWEFFNDTPDTHPIHLHLVRFQVLSRDGDRTGDNAPNAEGPGVWKDTVQVDPGETVSLIARFDGFTGKYPFHCHILEHEDHEMMRYFVVKRDDVS